jgi:UDP-2,3-diacylglucosamine pyrophosphatase LpxH
MRWYKGKSDAPYRRNFIDFVKKRSISADYLVLPGDVTHRAQPQEVSLASEFILQAADALNIRHDRIVFVPGNHDVDWSVFDPADTTGVRWEQRYLSVGHDRFHFKKIIDNGDGSVLAPPHFVIWEFDNLFVVGYNSSSHDAPIHKDAAHHGLADPTHLRELRNELDRRVANGRSVRLFLVHHHPLDFSYPIPHVPEFSLMTNAEQLLSIVHDYKFDILVHGHRHHPRFETHSTMTHPHVPVLCSGSFSVELDTEWAGTVENQFHLIHIEGRAGAENRICGKLESWTNNRARGWLPSEASTSGIDHVIPFGSYVMPEELHSLLKPFISNWLETHDHVLWRNVVHEFPQLEHLPLASAKASFDRIAIELGKQTMYATRKDLMLY